MMIDHISNRPLTSQNQQSPDVLRQKALQIGEDLRQIQQWCHNSSDQVNRENDQLQQELTTVAQAVTKTLATVADRLQQHLTTCDQVQQIISQQRQSLSQLQQAATQARTTSADAIESALQDQLASMRNESDGYRPQQQPQQRRAAL